MTDINGPIQADLYVESTRRDAAVSVAVSIVDAQGRSRGITNGLMSASFAQQDGTRSRYLENASGDQVSIQPWFPFTKAAHRPLLAGEIRHVPVEIFQVSARLQPGERLRISIAPADLPHASSTLVDTIDQAGGVVTLHVGGEHPASVTLPVVADD